MPELPDVEVMRMEVAEDSVKETISYASVEQQRTLKGLTAPALAKKLKGARITSTSRHGKNLFLELNGKDHLRIHFGMTGSLKYEKDEGPLPKHAYLTLHFKSGNRLLYIDPRKFGAVEYIKDLESALQKMHLGPDVESLSQKEFIWLLSHKKGHIKPVLMDQSFISGLGNVYTDEVLFQAAIHPERKIEDLSDKDMKNIFTKMKSVIKEAIKDHADRDQMPKSFLIHQRSAGGKCPKCKGGTIQVKQIGGRSTYFCTRCQA